MFLEPPLRAFSAFRRPTECSDGAASDSGKKRRRFDDSDGATSDSTEEGSDSEHSDVLQSAAAIFKKEIFQQKPSMIAAEERGAAPVPAAVNWKQIAEERGAASVPAAVNWKQIASNANQRMQEALLEGSECEVV